MFNDLYCLKILKYIHYYYYYSSMLYTLFSSWHSDCPYLNCTKLAPNHGMHSHLCSMYVYVERQEYNNDIIIEGIRVRKFNIVSTAYFKPSHRTLAFLLTMKSPLNSHKLPKQAYNKWNNTTTAKEGEYSPPHRTAHGTYKLKPSPIGKVPLAQYTCNKSSPSITKAHLIAYHI